MTVLDHLALAEQYLDLALEATVDAASGVEQEEALRRLYRSGRVALKAHELARRADYSCQQNERSMP